MYHFFKLVNQYRNGSLLKLPIDILMKNTIREVVETLGEPDEKMGGKSPITLIWRRKCESNEGMGRKSFGVQIEFVGNSWDDQKNEISCVTFFKPHRR